jgi:aldehyde:ferredoxin oxidoreductase
LSDMQGNITRYKDFTNISIPYFDKRFAEKKRLCPMCPSLCDYWTETETLGNCTLLKQTFNVEGQVFLYQIVTTDETWVRDFEPGL